MADTPHAGATSAQHFDIALIGSGSGNSLPGPEFSDRSIVYIDRGVGPERVFGGTCLNVGCIPTKMFVHTAKIAHTPATAAGFGLHETLDSVDWPAIRDRIFGRIDPITAGGLDYREHHPDNANLTLLRGTARFATDPAAASPASGSGADAAEKTRSGSDPATAAPAAPFTLEVALNDGGSTTVTADQVVLAAGSRATLPDVEGIAGARPHTSDTIMRIAQLPASLAILGSGVVAVEMASIFSALGVRVTVLARRDRVLRSADADVSAALTKILADRVDVRTGFTARSVERTGRGVTIAGTRDGRPDTVDADELLVATGRVPNGDLLGAAEAGLDVRDDGTIATDEFLRVTAGGTVVPGLWALGDVTDSHQLKHVANQQLRCVKHNMLHPGALRSAFTMPVPLGVFTDPPIASVGLTEEEARALDAEAVVATQRYADIAYGWAMEDTTGFAKVIAAPDGTLLGAHILGPEAPTLIQPLVQAMSTGQRVADIARTQYWIHPALPELVENALLKLPGGSADD